MRCARSSTRCCTRPAPDASGVYLPHDLPPKSAVYYYFALWRDDGTTETIHDLLRCEVRESRRRHEDPTAVALDSQTVRASPSTPKTATGLDVGAIQQSVPNIKPLRRLQIERRGLLTPVCPHEVGSETEHGVVVVTSEVTATRILHLDHACTQITERTCAHRGGDRLLKRDNCDS
jgi:hypothetical protein